MVVGLTTTCAISAYDHYHCEFEPCSWQGVPDTTLCDKVCLWLATGRWFSQVTPVIYMYRNFLYIIIFNINTCTFISIIYTTDFMQFVTPVRHNQQNLSKRTDLRLVFCNRKLMRTDIFFHWVLQGIFLKRWKNVVRRHFFMIKIYNLWIFSCQYLTEVFLFYSTESGTWYRGDRNRKRWRRNIKYTCSYLWTWQR